MASINNTNKNATTTLTQTAATLAQQRRRAMNKSAAAADTATRSGTSLKKSLLKTSLLALAGSSFLGRAFAAPIARVAGSTHPLDPRDSYTVVAGDSLWNIAESHDVAVTALEAANPQVTNVNLIIPGDVLEIPNAVNRGTPTQASVAPTNVALTADAAASLIDALQGQIDDLQGQIAKASPADVPALQQKQSDLMQQQSDVEAQLQNGGAAANPAPTFVAKPTHQPQPTLQSASTSLPSPTNVPSPTTAPASTTQSASPTNVPVPAPTGSGSYGDNVVSGSLAVGEQPAGVTVTGTGLWLAGTAGLGPVKNLAMVPNVNMATHVDALPATAPGNIGSEEWANALKFLPAANAAATKYNLPVLLLLAQSIQETSLGTDAPCTENSIGTDGKMHYDCGVNQVDDQWFPPGTSFADITNINNNYDHGAMVLAHYINSNGGTVQGGLSKYATDPTYYTKVVAYWAAMSSGS